MDSDLLLGEDESIFSRLGLIQVAVGTRHALIAAGYDADINCADFLETGFEQPSVTRPRRSEARPGEEASGETGGGQSYNTGKWPGPAPSEVRMNISLN